MIAVIDYGMGNLRSVAKGLERVGAKPKVTEHPGDVDDASGVVLPGVGAFPDCMKNLDRLNLIPAVLAAIKRGKPFLGICLGLQALFTESEEFGITPGLNVFSGRVIRFPKELREKGSDPSAPLLKIPHMGWNNISKRQEPPCLAGVRDGSHVYFVHSYFVQPDDESIIATTTDYGITFTSSIARDNLFASQFHPEKSQTVGLKILENFTRLVAGGL